MKRVICIKARLSKRLEFWWRKTELRFWWPALVVIFILLLGLIMRLPTIGDMALVALVAVTLMYVMSSHRQAQATTRMADEIRNQRFSLEELNEVAKSVTVSFNSLIRKGKTKREDTELDVVGITTMDILMLAWLGVLYSFIGFSLNNPKHAREYKDQILGTLREGGLNKVLLDIVGKSLLRSTERLEANTGSGWRY